ncbi:hypothetical protein [Streptomyces sp. NPDC058751]|uniref:hypothetical protein n=1 Tax=Streptomyces sp. NPDC058751 TaxID=3346623 RepID=UPI0036979DA0
MLMSSHGFGSSDPFGEPLNPAARRARRDGTSDLDTEHLLQAATKAEPARSLSARADNTASDEGLSGDGAEVGRESAELASGTPK